MSATISSMFNKTVYFLGKLAASNRKDATETVRRAGGKVARQLSASVQIVVVGEGDILSHDWNLWNDQLDAATRKAFEAGELEIVAEAFFWDRLAVSDQSFEQDDAITGNGTDCKSGKRGKTGQKLPDDKSKASLYTPLMLAELVNLPVSIIRRFRQQQLIVPVRQVRHLDYFDFDSVAPLKAVRNMLDAGLSLTKAVDRLRRIKQLFPTSPLEVQVRGNDLLFLTEKGPVDQDGQRHFDFVSDISDRQNDPLETITPDTTAFEVDPLAVLQTIFDPEAEPPNALALCEAAWNREIAGDLHGATDLYRAAIAADKPNPQINFQIAELLYRQGDLNGARERYFSAIELDDEFVEARANLGCVLAELGNDELAIAAFRGALRQHPEYAEVHFHLARLLKRNDFEDEAREHYRIFLELAPDSPWTQQIDNIDACR